MRRVDKIIIHCSATREGVDFTSADIDRWHRRRGFKGIGYHYVVRLDGAIEAGRPLDEAGAHCAGHNKQSVGICYIGGLDAGGKPKDTRTESQRASLSRLVDQLRRRFAGATVHGHREFAAKACPCFDVKKEYGL